MNNVLKMPRVFFKFLINKNARFHSGSIGSGRSVSYKYFFTL